MLTTELKRVCELSLGVALLLGASMAHGLDLGELEVASHLNEPFHGRISLSSPGEKSMDVVSVDLADAEEFQRAGMDYHPVLERLRFRLSRAQDDRPYIHVFSELPIGEPYLRFIVELRVGDLRLLRQYAVLLDPPGPYRRPFREPMGHGDGGVQTSGRTPGDEEVVYGPVRRSETLWSIAAALRPDASVSMQQVMLALLKANPEAFEHDNVNSLLRGAILRVPTMGQIRSVSARDALWEIRGQNAGVIPRGNDGRVSNVEALPTEASESVDVSAKDHDGAVSTPQEAPTPQEAVETVPGVAVETGLVEENLRLRARISVLEQDLAEMRRSSRQEHTVDEPPLVDGAAKDEDSLWDPGAKEDLPGDVARSEPKPIMDGGVGAKTPIREKDTRDLDPEPATNGMGDEMRQPQANGGDEPKPKSQAPEARIPESAPSVKTPRPKPIQAPENDPGSQPQWVSVADDMLADVMRDPLALGGLGGALILLLILMEMRRRASKEKRGGSGVYEAAGEHPLEDEVQAIAAYMKHGRYRQAERIFTHVLDRARRGDLEQKLPAIYAESENRTVFQSLAEKIHVEHGNDHPLWEKIAEIGRVVAPNHPLFHKDGASTEAIKRPTTTPPDEARDDAFDFADLGVEMSLDRLHEHGEHVSPGLTAPTWKPDEEGKMPNSGEAPTRDDEVAIKLDLAKTYRDMGNLEGARAMLDEVLSEGGEDQKREAEALISTLK